MSNLSKYSNITSTTVTRDLKEVNSKTDNIYEAIVVISKRANQISSQIKEELNQKLSEFATENDTLEEVFENREQIEISTYYERLPKPTLIATEEFLGDQVYFRNPVKEEDAEK